MLPRPTSAKQYRRSSFDSQFSDSNIHQEKLYLEDIETEILQLKDHLSKLPNYSSQLRDVLTKTLMDPLNVLQRKQQNGIHSSNYNKVTTPSSRSHLKNSLKTSKNNTLRLSSLSFSPDKVKNKSRLNRPQSAFSKSSSKKSPLSPDQSNSQISYRGIRKNNVSPSKAIFSWRHWADLRNRCLNQIYEKYDSISFEKWRFIHKNDIEEVEMGKSVFLKLFKVLRVLSYRLIESSLEEILLFIENPKYSLDLELVDYISTMTSSLDKLAREPYISWVQLDFKFNPLLCSRMKDDNLVKELLFDTLEEEQICLEYLELISQVHQSHEANRKLQELENTIDFDEKDSTVSKNEGDSFNNSQTINSPTKFRSCTPTNPTFQRIFGDPFELANEKEREEELLRKLREEEETKIKLQLIEDEKRINQQLMTRCLQCWKISAYRRLQTKLMRNMRERRIKQIIFSEMLLNRWRKNKYRYMVNKHMKQRMNDIFTIWKGYCKHCLAINKLYHRSLLSIQRYYFVKLNEARIKTKCIRRYLEKRNKRIQKYYFLFLKFYIVKARVLKRFLRLHRLAEAFNKIKYCPPMPKDFHVIKKKVSVWDCFAYIMGYYPDSNVVYPYG